MENNKVEMLIMYIAQSLVREPDAVTIRSFEEEGETILELKVADEDISLIIGKRGNVVKSLHSLLTYFSGHHDKSYRLKIVDAV